jgi:hypothetical protein
VSYTTIWPTLPTYDGNLPKIVSVAENIADNFRSDFALLWCKKRISSV